MCQRGSWSRDRTGVGRLTLVEPYDETPEVLSQEPSAAGDVVRLNGTDPSASVPSVSTGDDSCELGTTQRSTKF
jgi:hypothetical protein